MLILVLLIKKCLLILYNYDYLLLFNNLLNHLILKKINYF